MICSTESRYVSGLLYRLAINSTTVTPQAHFLRNRTLAALKEYDRLVKAIYRLNYIDNQELRRFVPQVLNKGEAYRKLRRKVAPVNGDKFRGGNDTQVALWN